MRKCLLIFAMALAANLTMILGCGSGSSPVGFTLAVSPLPITLTGGTSQSISIGTIATGGFNAPIAISFSGLPTGVSISPATLTITGGTGQNVGLKADTSVTAGPATFTVTGVYGKFTQTKTVSLTLVAAPPPDFSMSVDPTSQTVAQGAQGSISITASPISGFSAPVAVAITGLPAGVTATPASLTLVPGVAQGVSLSASTGTAIGNATVTFTGTSGTVSHAATLALTVEAPPSPPVANSTDVTTYHFDNARDGLNAHETILTPANVNSTSFGKVGFFAADGLVDAQPLYLHGLDVNGAFVSVLYMATENDSVYAFNIDTGTQIWQTTVLGRGETPSDDHNCGQITPKIGITSTPVIDRAKGTIYVVGMSKDIAGAYHQRLHALNLTTGAELGGSPVEITGTYPGTGAHSSGGSVIFDPGNYAERAGLLLLNGQIYLGWTSHCDTPKNSYTGWVMAYDENTLQQSAILNLTPNGYEGSIWMAGNGLAADASGNIYFLDANGTFDTSFDSNGFPAQHDFGNAMMKLSTAGATLAAADYFEPSNTASESIADTDLGSGGAMVLPDLSDANGTVRHLLVGAGKDTNIYVADRDNLGKFNAGGNSNLYQELPGALAHGAWSSPAYFNGTVYYAGQKDVLKAFPIAQAKLAVAPSSQSAAVFPYPGGTPSVSANGTQNAIVWALESPSGGPGVLHAYDATNLSNEFYNSNQAANGRDAFTGNKFITPVIADGKVFVGTPTGVAEFGLLP